MMKKSNLTILSLVAVIAISISSCCCSKKAINSGRSLEATAWKLVTLNGEANKKFAESDRFTMKFNNADSTYSGVAACNRFFGKFEMKKNGVIDIHAGASTMMACPNMELERPLLLMLDEADKYKIENGKLILYKGGAKVAEFAPYAATVN
ncbi:MAG: META domain-containing protein [Muribaculaceae bacterium]